MKIGYKTQSGISQYSEKQYIISKMDEVMLIK